MTGFDDPTVVADARNWLRRIEGQVKGILAMIDAGRECREMIQQIAAASKALDRIGCKLLVSQLQHCLDDSEAAEATATTSPRSNGSSWPSPDRPRGDSDGQHDHRTDDERPRRAGHPPGHHPAAHPVWPGPRGFIDGIVAHQILQWHHMGTSHGEHASFPMSTVSSLEDNTLWDGLFHLSTRVLVIVGLYLLWRAAGRGARAGWRSLTGLLLAGWGIFNLVEGIVDHQILGIHHVRDDLGGPRAWDLGFLAFGTILVAVGFALHRSDQARHNPRS